MTDLPPPNVRANNLHLTDDEFAGLLEFVRSERTIGKAWIFGSRRSGRPRAKDHAAPPDIDLAVDLVDVPDDDQLMAMFEIRTAAAEFFGYLRPTPVHIEFPGEGPTVAAFIAAAGATLIYERQN